MGEYEGDYEFSRTFVAAHERMPRWRRDQFDASMRDACALVNRIAAWMEHWEACGITDAEDYANGER